MKFLYFGEYRREVLVEKPIKRLSKIGQSKRNSHAKMQVSLERSA